MSTLAVDSITKADGSGSLSVPAETGTVVTTASPSLGRRNLIINGAMQVAQRGTSATGVTSNGYYTCDRFKNYISGLGTWSISQSTDAPDGFASSLKLDCTTADASPASSDYLQVGHFIEGQDLQQLQFGSSGAKSLTLSFWVKCNKTGTGRVHFAQPDASYRSIGGSYTISAANTWEQKTITIVGDTSGTINNDNGIGLEIIWWLDSGSNYNSGAMPTAWEADSAADRNAGGTLALGDSTDNEWYITGVQLEVGSVATPFEHRSYGEELALCQRYYQRSGDDLSNTSTQFNYFHDATTGNSYLAHERFPVQMRANPTVTISNNVESGFSSVAIDGAGKSAFRTSASCTSSGRSFFRFGWTAEAEL